MSNQLSALLAAWKKVLDQGWVLVHPVYRIFTLARLAAVPAMADRDNRR